MPSCKLTLAILLFIANCAVFHCLSEDVDVQYYINITPCPAVQNCSVGDFASGSSCTLGCIDPHEDHNPIFWDKPIGYAWKYYTHNVSDHVFLYQNDGVSTNFTTYDSAIYLTLNAYHPGKYFCALHMIDEAKNHGTNVYEFQISTSAGADLGEHCTDSTDCYALNSICAVGNNSDSVCQCTGEYDINFNGKTDTPACLKHEEENSTCNIDEECQVQNQAFECILGLCVCAGNKTEVAEMNDQTMCIKPAYLTTSCVYNEQCTLVSNDSYCNTGICDCNQGYVMNITGNLSKFYCYAQNEVLEVDSCSVDDFASGDSCTMSCSLPNQPYTNLNWAWKYYSQNETTYVNVYEGVSNNYNGDTIFTLLTLDAYYSGTYICEITLNDSKTFAARITIAQNSGVFLNDQCSAASDCYALNALCMNLGNASSACQCGGDYNIPYDNQIDTPACLKHQDENDDCNTDAECQVINQDYKCVENVCECSGNKTNVSEMGNETMCLEPKYLTLSCLYEEECQLNDINSFCTNGICECKNRYAMNQDGNPSQFYCYELPKIYPCVADDFNDGAGCSVICEVPNDGSMTVKNWSWEYYSHNESVYVNVTDGTSKNFEGDFSQIYLNLDTYYSGTYVCVLTVTDGSTDTLYSGDIEIATKPGVDIDGTCLSSTDCYALNAVCTTGESGSNVCECGGEYDINYTGQTDTPACVKS